MFGRSKPVVLQSYSRRRARWQLPSWLVLLLLGIALGVGGVILVQERYLPPRLSAQASDDLRRDFETARSERERYAQDLAEATRQLEASRAEQQRLSAELGTSRETAGALREDVQAIIGQLPPDPRGTPVGVRAARLTLDGGALAYDLLLTRERATGAAFNGVLQFVLAGETGRGARSSIGLDPLPVKIEGHESLRGRIELPEGFKPRQATINVLDKVDGRTFGRRVVFVR